MLHVDVLNNFIKNLFTVKSSDCSILLCADVPLSNYSLTHPFIQTSKHVMRQSV